MPANGLTWLLKNASLLPYSSSALGQLLWRSAAGVRCYDICDQMTRQPSCLARLQYASMRDAV